MTIPLDKVFITLVKEGSLSFSDSREGANFYKIAQGDPAMMQAMMGDPAMAGADPMAMAGADPMAMAGADPMAAAGMPAGMGADPMAAGGAGAAPIGAGMPAGASGPMTAVGEGVSNKDIESMVKIINLLMSMKSEYDVMKKDQMAMLQEQMAGAGGAAAPAAAAPAQPMPAAGAMPGA